MLKCDKCYLQIVSYHSDFKGFRQKVSKEECWLYLNRLCLACSLKLSFQITINFECTIPGMRSQIYLMLIRRNVTELLLNRNNISNNILNSNLLSNATKHSCMPLSIVVSSVGFDESRTRSTIKSINDLLLEIEAHFSQQKVISNHVLLATKHFLFVQIYINSLPFRFS